ncbi:MAG: DNA primase, partial [Bacteroides sp.]
AYTVYEFRYVNSQNFLQNRGFGRFRRLDYTWQFVQLEPPVVRVIEASDARDFLFNFAKHYCCKDVNEMLIKGVSQYVGPDKLSLINFIEPHFLKANRDSQYFYFEKTCWEINAKSIKELDYSNITHHIWEEQRKNFSATLINVPMIRFSKGENGMYNYEMSELGKKCHFLRFLQNTSNFTWRKEQARAKGEQVDIDAEELQENKVHLLSKLCAIGYMLMECKDPNVSRAVVGMDGKQSEVGESNGRSGKSLIGELFRAVSTITYIDGKKRDMFADNFLWNDVVEKTKIVFIDDVLLGFRFENLFPSITGDWSVNYKGGRRVTFPFSCSPKIYISTNHAISGTGSSFTDRQWLLAFSDYYNSSHKPADDFGCLFFSEWDYDQWNLTWNLLANCIQLYLTYGVVESPGERLEQRCLRQSMTEEFISWAEEYFSSSEHINRPIVRNDMKESYYESVPSDRKWVKSTEFKKRIVNYCKWKGYAFNPHKYDRITGIALYSDKDGRPVIDDKSGGIEYFTIGDENFYEAYKEDVLQQPIGSQLPFEP